MKGTITKFERRIIQKSFVGLKGGAGYSNKPLLGGYNNGAGAFSMYPEYQLLIYWKTETGKEECMDIRDHVKNNMSQSRITDKYLGKLTKSNVGKIVELDWNNTDHMRVIKDLNQIDIP